MFWKVASAVAAISILNFRRYSRLVPCSRKWTFGNCWKNNFYRPHAIPVASQRVKALKGCCRLCTVACILIFYLFVYLFMRICCLRRDRSKSRWVNYISVGRGWVKSQWMVAHPVWPVWRIPVPRRIIRLAFITRLTEALLGTLAIEVCPPTTVTLMSLSSRYIYRRSGSSRLTSDTQHVGAWTTNRETAKMPVNGSVAWESLIT